MLTSTRLAASINTLSKAFHSSSRNATNKLYELRVYSIKPTNVPKVMEVSKKPMQIRFEHSSALGYFFSEVGGIGESVHIWEYDSYAHRADIRKRLAADKGWMELSAPMIALFEKQDNLSMRLFPWSCVPKDVSPGGVYFLYQFTFKPSTAQETISNSLQQFIKAADLTDLGCWSEEIGPNSLRNAYAMFHSMDFDSVKNPALASHSAWSELGQHLEGVKGRLLSAAPWSAWK